jgi:hypothetical protein
MDFVISLLAAGRVTVQPAFVLRLLRHLAGGAGRGSADAREGRFIRVVQVGGGDAARVLVRPPMRLAVFDRHNHLAVSLCSQQ